MSGMALYATETTREVFWGLSPILEGAFYFAAFVTTTICVYGFARLGAKYARGARSGPPRRELPRRLLKAGTIVVSHVWIKLRSPGVGWAHRGIFFGFSVLFVGTVILGINTDITKPLFGWDFFQGPFYLGYSLTLDIFGLALIGGVTFMAMRRGVFRPRRLDYSRPDRPPGHPQQARVAYRRGDWIFLGALLVIALTGYLLEGARMAITEPAYAEFSPVGWVIGEALAPAAWPSGALEDFRYGLWWVHGIAALVFVASIPYTKAAHMLISFWAIVMRDTNAGRRLEPISADRAAEPAGYGRTGDFSSRHLLSLDACTKCGRCHEVCPANATGQPLSPRDVILELRETANRSFQTGGVSGVLGTLLGRPIENVALGSPVVGEDAVRLDTIWSCYQCNACVEACPVSVEQAPIINQLRRRLVEDGQVEPKLQETFEVVHKTGNSFGESRRRRGKWTQPLPFAVKDARREPVDVLWFVGDYASFDPRSQEVSRGLARIFQAAEVDFGILYDGERNAGNDVRRAGEEGLWETLAEANIATLASCSFNRIVTSDPHSLNTLSNEYSDLGGQFEVMHHTAFLLELLKSGAVSLQRQIPYRVTYHDPCYLGRMNGGFDAPRNILDALGCTLVEMPRNRSNSFCCGAGGGRIWTGDFSEAQTERPSENRIREALALGKLDYFVVSCPKDVTMYEDAIKTSGSSDSIELREVTELVEEALSPVDPASRRSGARGGGDTASFSGRGNGSAAGAT